MWILLDCSTTKDVSVISLVLSAKSYLWMLSHFQDAKQIHESIFLFFLFVYLFDA